MRLIGRIAETFARIVASALRYNPSNEGLCFAVVLGTRGARRPPYGAHQSVSR